MNKINLIKLGAFAQRKYNLPDDFRIMEVPSDSYNSIHLAIPQNLSVSVDDIPEYMPIDEEVVTLEKIGVRDNFEYIWMGYARRAHVLVIKDCQDVFAKRPTP